MNSRSSLFAGLIILVIIAGAVVYRLQEGDPVIQAAGGRAAPAVVTRTLDGAVWRLADQRGKVVLVDFWATWCGPCIAAMPHMKQVYDRFKSDPDFVMVGVSLDEQPEDVRRFVDGQKIGWLQLFDPAQPFARAFGVGGIPSVWVIGRQGQIAGRELYGPEIENTVAAELARK